MGLQAQQENYNIFITGKKNINRRRQSDPQ